LSLGKEGELGSMDAACCIAHGVYFGFSVVLIVRVLDRELVVVKDEDHNWYCKRSHCDCKHFSVLTMS